MFNLLLLLLQLLFSRQYSLTTTIRGKKQPGMWVYLEGVGLAEGELRVRRHLERHHRVARRLERHGLATAPAGILSQRGNAKCQ